VDADSGTVVWLYGFNLAPEGLHGDDEPESALGL
jgi:hypothetical protein